MMWKFLILTIAMTVVARPETPVENIPIFLPRWSDDEYCEFGREYLKDCNICYCSGWGAECTEIDCERLPNDVRARINTKQVLPLPDSGEFRVAGQIYKLKCGYGIVDELGVLYTVLHCDETIN